MKLLPLVYLTYYGRDVGAPPIFAYAEPPRPCEPSLSYHDSIAEAIQAYPDTTHVRVWMDDPSHLPDTEIVFGTADYAAVLEARRL